MSLFEGMCEMGLNVNNGKLFLMFWPLSLTPNADRWVCDLTGDGNFRVKEVRNFLDDLVLPSYTESTRWVKWVPIKINIFVWRAHRDCLPTRYNLSRKGVMMDTLVCPLCDHGVETTHHVLFQCPIVRSVFYRICSWWELEGQDLESFSEWQNWFLSIRMPAGTKNLLDGGVATFWVRKAVSNEAGVDIPPQVSQHLDSQSVCGDEVSTSTPVHGLGVTRGGRCCVVPVLSTCIQDNLCSFSTFCASAAGSTFTNISAVETGQGGGHYAVGQVVHNSHLPEHNNGQVYVSLPVRSTAAESTIAGFPTFCGPAVDSSSRGILTTEIGGESDDNNRVRPLVSSVQHQVEVQHGQPAQVPMVDGSVSTFQVANTMWPFQTVAPQPAIREGQPNSHMDAPQVRVAAAVTRQPGYMHILFVLSVQEPVCATNLGVNHCGRRSLRGRQRVLNGQPNVRDPHAPPVQGPVAPPQRQDGLIEFLDQNNALVKLFRTARDKLREANIPNFSIRLFGVAGATQYEPPTADSIGAIVYEGGPETMTDYDVVIQRHSGEPESVNKLHPAYMALQFPLLFIYGEEGYHLKLTVTNPDGPDQGGEKRMSMKNVKNQKLTIVYIIPAYSLMCTPTSGKDCFRILLADPKMSLTINAGAPSPSTDTSILPSRQFAYFTELNPTDNSKYIEARIYRKWTAVKVPSFTPIGFSCILLDKKGSALQANADLKEKERFERDLQINSVYRIHGFGFEKTDGWGKTLDNDFTLCFGKYTQTDLLQDNDFPYHYFNFAAFNELNARLEKKIRYSQTTLDTCTTWKKSKNMEAQLVTESNNNVVLFTLWNEDADRFEEDEYAQMKQPVILAVSSCYLKRYAGQIQLSATSATRYYFNPDVQETGELLAAYNETQARPAQLQVQTKRLTNWEDERNRNRVPLATLLQIDPKTQQRVLFTQEAMILQIDTGHDWYYQKCDECGGKLRYGYLHGQCHQYGTKPNPENSYCFRVVITDGTGNATLSCFTPQTDGLIKDINTLLQEVEDKNPATIPAAILALKNTRHTFQFQFATPTTKGPPTFVLKKVMDNPPSALLETSAGPSSPPTVTTVTHTDEESTPPPATPVLTQDTPIDIPTTTTQQLRPTAKKELFGDSSDKGDDPASKKQKKE
ncbi:nucleic acid-binding, OB-fold protein [Artemisia annua]|uniref:Nucleic acid-binding, OB-fold protein n=1 Tax=Artemisia annua TaxID=35608 RepID=A0A2U1NRP0_ARTAN|nr:nucleic acid-binding, OB-fold protein [Artemisia annua]